MMKVLKERLYKVMDENQGREQAGFRHDHSTIDQIFILNQIIQKANEYQIQVNLLLIDFQKAFDTVEHWYTWETLKSQGVGMNYIRIIRSMYDKVEAYIRTDYAGKKFPVNRGVRHGDPLSPNLFNCVLEEVFRGLNWDGRGLNINGEYLINLRFADDVILISNNTKELEEMGKELIKMSTRAGLKINSEKTQWITNGADKIIHLEGKEIKCSEEVTYLGQIISFKNRR